jgi:integrase
MRNPNGYGSVIRLSGKNRRKPWAVRKTVGFNEKGHPTYQFIGYYTTREEAILKLAEYNKEPWDINLDRLTLSELYIMWLDKKSGRMGESNLKALKSAYKYLSPLYDTKYNTIKAYHMQDIIDNCGHGSSTQTKIKSLFGHLDNFALECDIITRQYSTLLKCDPAPTATHRVPFTDEEVNRLWELSGDYWVDTVLVFLYTGFRLMELLKMPKSNVNLDDMTFTGGIKSKAGKDRVVPIHSRIQPIVIKFMQSNGGYILGSGVSQTIYYKHWRRVMSKIGASHTVHETRHTFRTRLDNVNANKKCIDMLMGHTSKDVGERVYTHKTVEELRSAIELIE